MGYDRSTLSSNDVRGTEVLSVRGDAIQEGFPEEVTFEPSLEGREGDHSRWKESGGRVCVCARTQSHPTLCDPMDDSLPGSSVHGIFQARMLECVAISYSRRSSRLGD